MIFLKFWTYKFNSKVFPPNTFFSKIFYKIRQTWILYDFFQNLSCFHSFLACIWSKILAGFSSQNHPVTQQVIPAPYTAQKIAEILNTHVFYFEIISLFRLAFRSWTMSLCVYKARRLVTAESVTKYSCNYWRRH